MPFKKQFPKESFISVLSTEEWQKTGLIAEKMGCSRQLVTDTLLKMEEVEFRWVPGGKQGTREWKMKE